MAMGNVVRLEPGKAGPSESGAGKRRRSQRPSKTALVLGGGGFTGGVYEVGALRAINLLSVNKTVNEFDIYVGTSAGAFVAALTANGVTPEEMMRVVNHQVPTPFHDIDLTTLLRPDLLAYARSAIGMPLRTVRVLRQLSSQLGQVSAMDLLLGLAEGLPAGVYSGRGIERYVRDVLADPERSDDFRTLRTELYLAATDLDTCERIVFGADGWDDVPISTAVRASTALPMVYEPTRVRDRDLIDGGIVSTTNIDIAVEAGAKFIVVVNPLVPYAAGDRRIKQMGLPQIGYQSFKMMAYQRLHEAVRRWEQRYPGVDIILIEPEPDDELMFETSIMNFTSRVEVARHGFESVTLKLASEYERYQEICKRHGIDISATRVRKVVRHFSVERERTRAWRKILEQATPSLLRQSRSSEG